MFLYSGLCSCTQGCVVVLRNVFLYSGLCSCTQDCVLVLRTVFLYSGLCFCTQDSLEKFGKEHGPLGPIPIQPNKEFNKWMAGEECFFVFCITKNVAPLGKNLEQYVAVQLYKNLKALSTIRELRDAFKLSSL